MARIYTVGGELGVGDASGSGQQTPEGLGDGIGVSGTLASETTIKRSGNLSWRVTNNAGQARTKTLGFLNPASVSEQYVRDCVYFAAWPAATTVVLLSYVTNLSGYSFSYIVFLEVRVSSTGVLSLWVRSGGVMAQVGSNTQLSLSTWYRVEVRLKYGGGATGSIADMRVEGVSIGSSSPDWSAGASGIAWAVEVGAIGVNLVAPGTGATVYHDDMATNDTSGSSQNSWCGDGRVIVLKPVSDNARGATWTTGVAGTTNLWDAVDNVPPVGVALASATGTSQIKDVGLTTTDNYDANVTDYSTAGVGSTDTVTLVQVIGNIGSGSSTFSEALAIKAVSNPADSTEANSTLGTTAGTYPNNWLWLQGNVVYAPSVTKPTQPVVRVGKRSSNAGAAMCDFLGLLVEYQPAAASFTPPVSRALRQAVQRSAVR